MLVMGSVVTTIQTSFIEYWNSRWSYPIDMLGDEMLPDISILIGTEPPSYQHFPELPIDGKSAAKLLKSTLSQMNWVDARFVYDPPVPIDSDNTDLPKVTAVLLADLARESKHEILLESAYLVFDDGQLDEWHSLSNNNVEIKALTNSMASNDLVTNHSAYAGRRSDMLEHGIELFELKPESKLCETSTKDASKCAPSTAYGLHAKSVVFDKRIASIGSFNFNLRSTYLNTESVLIIENKEVAETLAETIEQAMSEENSWRLELEDGDMYWYSGEKSWDSEPETGKWERMQSGFLQLLPIEKYL